MHVSSSIRSIDVNMHKQQSTALPFAHMRLALIPAKVSINCHLCRRDHADEAQESGSGGHRGGYQAYSSMVFAQGGVPQQHVTANEMPSPETDVQRNDLALDASRSRSEAEGSGGMGSLTGWQALANEVGLLVLPQCSAIFFLEPADISLCISHNFVV